MNNYLFLDLSAWYFLGLGDRHSRASPNISVGAIAGLSTNVSSIGNKENQQWLKTYFTMQPDKA